ncbi:DNA polymerase III subunit alpha [Cardiobacteriales bacterium ML27]|uniref:DNA polymerase III subunit alpha n=1 Tax=Ostreibacterium oceani TaxID=2654998 RepID=A0A6N7ETU4_9GAMM|nr:DNA polymerase III subunit alpha [Ostreibacterium oceani]
MTVPFAHLRVHSEFSLSDGMLRIKSLAKHAKDAGYDSIALTDINNIYGLIKFYKSALAVGIKPILGAEVYVRSQVGVHKLVLLCQNNQGYTHLCEIISAAYLSSQSNQVIAVEESVLREHAAGLIALSAAHEGLFGQHLLDGRYAEAEQVARDYQTLFEHQFYIEVQRLAKPQESTYLARALTLADKLGIPAVATNHACFLAEKDFYAHEARVCINRGDILNDDNRVKAYSEQQYLKSSTEMAAVWEDYPELLTNAHRIAQKCNVTLTLGESYLPAFANELGLSEADYLVKVAQQGLTERLQQQFVDADTIAAKRSPYDQRLAFELDVINQMGFPGYFLIVADFIQWSKENQIPVGPGRGSGAGSLVAYALKITDLDPLAYDLLFERFLNPERVSMPDFDIDFCMEKRDLVIDYVAQKYGRDKVSQIATHGTMAAKAVVRDVGRVLGYGYGFVDSIAKLIPFEIGMTLTKALDVEPELKKRYDDEEEVQTLLTLALSLEGLARNVGKHAGGVVIAPSKLTDFSALYCEPDGKSIIVQYDKDDIEAAGLVKFDFLGLRTLTIIDWALKNINDKRQSMGESIVEISKIPLDDDKTYTLLKACHTTAVFQLESSGMKDLLKRLQPDRFDDIIALVALFRPGPLQSGMVDDFINVKHGRADANYPLAELKPILAPTYGVILYQEQVMQIAQVLASYTLGEADMLRRAMGKKKPEEMAKQGALFIDGAVKNGHDQATAKYIFDLMEKFAGYGFNKSHSAAYALLAYQTAWLKTHYPQAFMAAVLSADMDNTDKIVTLIEECRQMGLTLRPPSLNESAYQFTVNAQNEIVYGLGAIKGAGEAALKTILETRQTHGAFASVTDFFLSIDLAKLNKRVLEALIKAGVFDLLTANRRFLLKNLDAYLKLAEQTAKNKKTGQNDLFGMMGLDSVATAGAGSATPAPVIETQPCDEWSAHDKLSHEKSALGLYLTGHPIESYLSELREITQQSLAQWLSRMENEASPQSGHKRPRGQPVILAGLLTGIRVRQGQRGKMAFATIDDRSARTEIRFFSDNYDKNRDKLADDSIIVVVGKAVYDDFAGAWRVNGETVYALEELREQFVTDVQIQCDPTTAMPELLEAIKTHQSAAGAQVFLAIQTAHVMGKLQLPKTTSLPLSPECYQALTRIVGKENMKMRYQLDALTAPDESVSK